MTEYELTCNTIITVDAENRGKAKAKAAEKMSEGGIMPHPDHMEVKGER